MIENIMKEILKNNIQIKGKCLFDNNLAAFYENKATEEERQAILEHLETCIKCTDLWRNYHLFMEQPLDDVPETTRQQILQNIQKQTQTNVFRIIPARYFAYAAILLIAVLSSTLLYTYFQLKNAHYSTAQLIHSITESRQEIVLLHNKLSTQEKEFAQMQSPLVDVPIYDLYPEGIYKRDTSAKEILSVNVPQGKPFHLILNLKDNIEKPSTINLLNSAGQIVWLSKIETHPQGSLALLFPSKALKNDIYTIELRDAQSSKLLSSYHFKINW